MSMSISSKSKSISVTPMKNKPTAHRSRSFTLLVDAIGEGNSNVVKQILQTSRDPVELLKTKDLQGLTPLRKAVALSMAEIIRILVMAGADASQKGALDKTALHEAALQGQRLLIAPLLASTNMNVNVKDKFGMSPLHNAVRGKHLKAVEWLLFAGADVNSLNIHEESPLTLCNPDSDNATERQIAKLLRSRGDTTIDTMESPVCCGYVGPSEIAKLGSNGLLMFVTSGRWPSVPIFVFCIRITPEEADPQFPLRQDERFYCQAYKYRLMYQLPPGKCRVKVYFTVMEEFMFSELILKVTSKSKYLGEIPMKMDKYPYHKYINFLASCELDLQNEGHFVMVKRPMRNRLEADDNGLLSCGLISLFQLATTKDTFPAPPKNWNSTRKQRAWEEHEQLIKSQRKNDSGTADSNENKTIATLDTNNMNANGGNSMYEEPEEEDDEEEELVLLDWSEPDTCEDFYFISPGWGCYIEHRRVLTSETLVNKYPAEIEEPIVRCMSNFFRIHHPSNTLNGTCLCQIGKTEHFVKNGTVLILERKELGPDEKEDPYPDETNIELNMSEDGRHTNGQAWLQKEMKRWSLISTGFTNKPTRVVFEVDKLCTYVAVQLNIGEEGWEPEEGSDEENGDDDESEEGEAEEANGEENPEKKKKKKKKKGEEGEEGNGEDQAENKNASNLASENGEDQEKNKNASNLARNTKTLAAEELPYTVEETVFLGIDPIDAEFAGGLESSVQDRDPAEELSAENLVTSSLTTRKISLMSRNPEEGMDKFTFGAPRKEEEFEEDQMTTLLTEVALMWRCRNHREAHVIVFTRHKRDTFFDMAIEIVQESDLAVRAECRWSEGFKMVACSPPFMTLSERLFTLDLMGPMTIVSPENAASRNMFYLSIYVTELLYEVKRVPHDELPGKKLRKKEDPTLESNDIDATLEMYAFPKGCKSDAIHICDMNIPFTGPNVWKKNHLSLREPDSELLDAIVAELKAEPSLTNNWWKIWILLHFEEKQVDTEKVKQDWPAITELLLKRWFDQNIDSRDRGIATLIYILESLGLDQALVKLIAQLGKYKFKLLEKTNTPRELDLLFHWVTNTKMTLGSFRRKAPEPPVLWPLSDQFLLYFNEYLDPEILLQMGQNLEVEDNMMHSINGEENITDPRYKTFKVLIKSRQKKDQVVGFTLLLTDMVKARQQVEACHFLVRETRRWMASIIDTQPETCTKLENVLQLV